MATPADPHKPATRPLQDLPDDPRNLILAGFMGTGKSTTGRHLASLTGRLFVDTDDEITRRAGMSIPQIFDHYGEGVFRALEKRLSRALSRTHRLVIATGGGLLIDAENRAMILECGHVIALDADIETIAARLARSNERPLKHGWRERLEARRPIYDSLPYHIDTTRKTPEAVAQEVIALWRKLSP